MIHIANQFLYSLKFKFKIIFSLGLLGILCSCNSVKFLQANEVLLAENKIDLKAYQSSEDRLTLTQELSTLYKQKPNRNYLFFIDREWFYYYLNARKNKKIWLRKTLQKQSEPPAILDTLLIQATEKNMYNYLFNKGYFNVKVSNTVKTKKKRANVQYLVEPKNRYYVKSLVVGADDTSLLSLVQSSIDQSLLKPGSPLDFNVFQSEKSRISELLLNHGYAEFNPVYIQNLDIDTMGNFADVNLNIINPENKTEHKKYTIQNIQILNDYYPVNYEAINATLYDSILFLDRNSPFYIRNSVIAKRIGARPGLIYNKSNIEESYAKIAKLGFFKFINIESKVDSIDPSKLNQSVYLTPHKLWVFDYGTDVSYTTLKTTGQNLFGISGFINLKNRNIFHGAENFDTKLEAGTEISFLNINRFNSVNFSYSNELTLPDFLEVTRTYKWSRFLLKPWIKMPVEPETKTAFSIGFDYVNLTSLYSYNSLNSKISYDFNVNRRKRITMNTFSVSYYVPKVFAAFDSIISKNQFLQKSFVGQRLFTSFFLGDLRYYYQSKKSPRYNTTFIGSIETSGLEVSLIKSVSNLFKKNASIDTDSKLEFSRFIKLEGDQRWYYSLKGGASINGRFNAGVVFPYGNSKTTPYIKQFYLGGPQSLRAWGIREPGPGADPISRTVDQTGTYYSAGDVKIEANIEFRFDLVWIFKGAFFVDAGNIWLLPHKNQDSELGTLSKYAYKQIAVGSGFGLRMDLSYFLFRIDIGFKLRNPYPDENGNYGLYYPTNPVSIKGLWKDKNIHLALNYPF
jgi:outer membrane protein insertion porin family